MPIDPYPSCAPLIISTLKKTKVLVLDVLGSVCAQYTRCTDLQITSSDLVSSSLLLSMLMSNSVQPANEHDTMIKPQGVLLTNLFLP